MHQRRFCNRVYYDLDIFADQPRQQHAGLLQDRIHVQHPGRDHLLAAEGQQLPRETLGLV